MDNESKATPQKKNIVIIILVIIILALVAGGVAFYIISNKKSDDDTGNKLGYESNLVTDEDGLQKAVDDMVKKAEEGNMSLEYKNIATSSDGENFSCYIMNSVENSYDMYLSIYEDSDFKDEIMLTELIPVGSGIDTFKTSKKFDSGSHSVVLVFTQVEDDHSTIHAQISVELTLNVE